jgi:hydroxymethylbilane synthase
MHIRLGTRQSPLALWQATHISALLHAAGHDVEIVKIVTTGDVSTLPLGTGGGVGLFTKEIQRALLDNRCDLAVHSLKDLPTEPIPGLQLAAIPERERASDCFVSKSWASLSELPENSRVGTGSPRRRAQLLRLRPDIEVIEIRGNVDTRLKKLEAGDYDAIVLAYAGLHRLGLLDHVTTEFSFEEMLPAVGQAALGLETRSDDSETAAAVAVVNHLPTQLCVSLERAILRTMQAGCLAPLAVHAAFDGDKLRASCRVFSTDFSEMIEQQWAWPAETASAVNQAVKLGESAASDLCELGADELIHPN